jgi:hypothetical protein
MNETIYENIKNINKLIQMSHTFGNKVQLENLFERFYKFSEIENIKILEQVYLPKIEKLNKMIDHWNK